MTRLAIAALASLCLLSASHAAELRGHGGPVRGLAVSADGRTAFTGSFDSTAILWSLDSHAATRVMRFHDGAVNAVALLEGGRAASAGEDGRIAIWEDGSEKPVRVLEGHSAPVVALVASSDRRHLGSAAWDGTARIWPLDGDAAPRVLEGHEGNVNGIGFLASGDVATVGYDASLRIWPEVGPAAVHRFPTALNALAVLDGETLAIGGADGILRLVTTEGETMTEAGIAPTPVTSIAVSSDGRRLAAAGVRGAVSILAADPNGGELTVERTLVGPGMPVWSLAFIPGTDEILTGGSDRIVRRWNALTGENLSAGIVGALADPLAAYAGDPGAQVFRACVACHSLQPGEGMRAGPTLHGVMGRRIASVPGYDYSPSFAALDIVWTPETIARLFEIGPHAYTPGTKMPEQTIIRAEDRAALVRFLETATAPE